MYGTFQDPQGLYYTHKTYWIHQSIIQYYYTVLYHYLESSPYPKAGLIYHQWFKELLYQENGCVSITFGTKKYWTHWLIIQYLTVNLKGRSDMPLMIQRGTVRREWLLLNHVLCIPWPTGSALSAPEILDWSVHYPVLDHPFELRPCATKCMIIHERFKEPLNKYLAHCSRISMNCTHTISSLL